MTDRREMIATLFERTASLAETKGLGLPPEAAAAMTIGAAIAKTVAALIRALGIDDAKVAIDELVARRNEGVISDEHVARDNATIADAVSSMYEDDAGTSTSKPKRSKRKPRGEE